MLEAAAVALDQIFTVQYLSWMLLGVAVGMFVGVIPGLGGSVGMSLLLPFVFGMDAYTGLALLMGMAAVIHTSDTFPSVLLGVPGSAGAQATIMDGYPLAQQGQAGRALGASFFVSMIGGLIGAVALLGTILAVRPLVLALGAPELFMLSVLGLSMVGILTQGSPLAGLLSGALGLALGGIGAAPATANYRFTFDTLYLMDGIPLVIIALGVFALPEMIDLLVENRPISQAGVIRGGRLQGVRDGLNNKFLVFRSAVVGNLIGIIPGLGGSVVDWITYGIAKQTLKNTDTFGKGDIRGVIAPEAANNAKEAGTLVPTFLFGIPGSPTSAILLGGLTLLGLQAGPDMVGRNLDVTLSVIWTLAAANVVAAGVCFALTNQVAKISLIPAPKLVPFLLVVMVFASYQASRHWGDILVFLFIGLLSWFMKQLAWPRAPLIIGFVLAKGTERYLFISIERYEYSWLTRPGVLILAALVVGLLLFGFASGARKTGTQDEEGEKVMSDATD